MAIPSRLRPRTRANSVLDIDRHNPKWKCPVFEIEGRRCWGLHSANVINRAAGWALCRTEVYRLTYFLTDFHAALGDDDRSEWECDLLQGHFTFRPPQTELRSDLSAGRYIQILQHPNTYHQLTSEMVRGGMTGFTLRYHLKDALISQLVSTLAN